MGGTEAGGKDPFSTAHRTPRHPRPRPPRNPTRAKIFTAYAERSGWDGDDPAVSGGPGPDGLLDQPGEAVADEGGGAAVEPEDVLVEVGGEVLLAHRAVVGAQEPAFGEAEDEMDGGQPEGGVTPGGARADRLV